MMLKIFENLVTFLSWIVGILLITALLFLIAYLVSEHVNENGTPIVVN